MPCYCAWSHRNGLDISTTDLPNSTLQKYVHMQVQLVLCMPAINPHTQHNKQRGSVCYAALNSIIGLQLRCLHTSKVCLLYCAELQPHATPNSLLQSTTGSIPNTTLHMLHALSWLKLYAMPTVQLMFVQPLGSCPPCYQPEMESMLGNVHQKGSCWVCLMAGLAVPQREYLQVEAAQPKTTTKRHSQHAQLAPTRHQAQHTMTNGSHMLAGQEVLACNTPGAKCHCVQCPTFATCAEFVKRRSRAKLLSACCQLPNSQAETVQLHACNTSTVCWPAPVASA